MGIRIGCYVTYHLLVLITRVDDSTNQTEVKY